MEAVENCSNCKKPFPESKIDIHFAYCRRNIRKCQQCDEMVDINHLEEHMQQEHTKEICEHCSAHINAKDIADHRRKCTLKPVVCAYCQQSVPVQTFDEHQYQCGSRTKACLKCHKAVLLREFDIHEATCEGLPTPATVRAYTNYNDYLRKQREQLGMPSQPEIKPPKPIERIRVTAKETKEMDTKTGQSPTLKHSIKELGTRVVQVKAPRLHGTGQVGYFGDPDDEQYGSYNNYYPQHPSGGRVISTTVTTKVDGKVISTNTYPASTYQGGTVPTYPVKAAQAPIKSSVTEVPVYKTSAPASTDYHGLEDEDAQLQRALMASLGYM